MVSSGTPLPTRLTLPGRFTRERLDNGLEVVLIENPRAPIVTTALFYRVGTRDEAPGQGGTAHFLEHMMFKGSPRYGPGEVDEVTQRLGGSNNAFTSHDTTAYYFQFASDRWQHALDVEADRMTALTLDQEQVELERNVILEEIAMYDADPWSALDAEVSRALFGEEGYGLPVLGTRDQLEALDVGSLAAFHARFYVPSRSVLVVAGDVEAGAIDLVKERFSRLPEGDTERAPAPAQSPAPDGPVRIERRQGSVSRFMLAFPGPSLLSEAHPALRVALAALAGGRTARLQRVLVEEEQLCLWVQSELREHQGPGLISLALEPTPDADPARVEARVLELLATARTDGFAEEELERARRTVVSDWVFGHERIHQQALAAGFASALFDLEQPVRYLTRLLSLGAEEIHAAVRQFLEPESGAVLGWSRSA